RVLASATIARDVANVLLPRHCRSGYDGGGCGAGFRDPFSAPATFSPHRAARGRVNAPAVTVLMPVLNGERFVGAAIASILAQTWTDFELVFIDDGSTDGTSGVVASFADPRIRVITNRSPEGVARALNRGLAAARAPLVARHDSDDIAHPKRLETQLAFLRGNPEVILAGTQ